MLQRIASGGTPTDLLSMLAPAAPAAKAGPASFAEILHRHERLGSRGDRADTRSDAASLYDSLVGASSHRMLASIGNSQSPEAKILRDLVSRAQARSSTGGDVRPADDAYRTARLKAMADGFGPGDAMLASMSQQDASRAERRRSGSSLADFFTGAY